MENGRNQSPTLGTDGFQTFLSQRRLAPEAKLSFFVHWVERYLCGLRLQECLDLRVKDVNFEQGVLTVRSGKGDRDRQTVLPESLHTEWLGHLERIRKRFDQDRAEDQPGVYLPDALERKDPNAGKEWASYWAFPAFSLSMPRTAWGTFLYPLPPGAGGQGWGGDAASGIQ